MATMSKENVILVVHNPLKPHKSFESRHLPALKLCILVQMHCDLSFLHPDVRVPLCRLTLEHVSFSETHSSCVQCRTKFHSMMSITVQRPNTDSPL